MNFPLKSGFSQASMDKTLVLKHSKAGSFVAKIYVDNMVIGYSNDAFSDEFEKVMSSNFVRILWVN